MGWYEMFIASSSKFIVTGDMTDTCVTIDVVISSAVKYYYPEYVRLCCNSSAKYYISIIPNNELSV